jgi:F0F1-type ATP synthase assembly protein I
LPLKKRGCYTSAASQGRFQSTSAAPDPRKLNTGARVHDPIAAGRRAATHAIAVQIAVVAVVAALFLVQGPRHALAAATGGVAMVLGNAMAATFSLAGISPAGIAFGRLLLGTMAKWLVAIAVLALALGLWRLPPLPVIAGLAAGLLAYLLALNFPALRRKRKG